MPNGGFSYLPDSLISHQVAELVKEKGAGNVQMDDIDKEKLRKVLVEELTLAHRWDLRAEAMCCRTSLEMFTVHFDLGAIRGKINKYGKETKERCHQKLSGITQRQNEETAELEEGISKVKFLKKLKSAVAQAIQNLKSGKCSAKNFRNAKKLAEDLEKSKNSVQDMRAYTDESSELEVGDSVRFKYDLGENFDDFISSDVTHLSVGILLEKPENDEAVRVVFPEDLMWKGSMSVLEKSLKKSKLPYIGDDVKILAEQPHFGWQGVRKKNCPGTLTKFDLSDAASGNSPIVYVKFPEANQWKGLYKDLLEQTAPQERLTEGDWLFTTMLLGLFGHPELMPPIAEVFEHPALTWTDEVPEPASQQKAQKKRAVNRAIALSTVQSKPSEIAKKEMRSHLQRLNDSCSKLNEEPDLLISKAKNTKDSLPSKADKLKRKIEDVIEVTKERCTKKLQKEPLEARALLIEFDAYIKELRDLRKNLALVYKLASESLNALSGSNTSPLHLRQAEANMYKLKSTNNAVRRMQFGVDSFYEWKEGACTRLNPLNFTQESMRKYMEGETTIGTIGLQLKLGQHKHKGKVLVIFDNDENPQWVDGSDTAWILARRQIPFKGDKVRFKRLAITMEPHSEQATTEQVSPNGILKNIFPKAVVDFPGHKEPWVGPYKDIELVPECEFEVGDRVWVRKIIPEPSRGWGEVNGSSVGTITNITRVEGKEEITVDFPECEGWIGLPTDIERERLANKEDEVQVKLSINEPRYGWQSVSERHDAIGIIVDMNETGTECAVAFGNTKFKCSIDEIEPYRYHRAHYDMPRSEVDELGTFVSKDELRKLIKANLWS
ncbi:uncharacterized protein [Watersipora subatra]|uniref:uncharacterized protein n=1 Tax=Watersipora subatra TaxID=2589382 RepID=UPI00355C4AF7